MKSGLPIFVYSLLILSIFMSCAPPERAKTPAAPASEILPPSKASWETEWEKVLAEAKKEGTVVVLCGDASRRVPLTQEFKKKYGITAEFVIGRSGERVAKVISERRANLYVNDVWLSGTEAMLNDLKAAGYLDRLEPALMLPEVTDAKYWLGNKLYWADKDRYVLIFLTAISGHLSINTNLVLPGDLRSYKDLLNPRWKGKMTMNDPTVDGAGMGWITAMLASGQLDLDYMRRLVAQEPVIMRDQRLQVEWLAQGKYPIAIAAKTDIVREFRGLGSPLQIIIPPDGSYISEGGGAVALFNRAPHPNAAKVFINWLLSREGQTVDSRAYGRASLRVDVPADFVDPIERPQPGMNYFWRDEKYYTEERPRLNQLSRELFKPLTQ